jgi:hypothetical protein
MLPGTTACAAVAAKNKTPFALKGVLFARYPRMTVMRK